MKAAPESDRGTPARMSAIEQALACTRVRVSMEPIMGHTYAIHSEVFLDETGHEFVIVKCHYHSKQRFGEEWVVELKNEPGDEDAPWTMQWWEGDEMEVSKLTGIGDVFAQPQAHFVSEDGLSADDLNVTVALLLRNEYDEGPTWTDFYKGTRKVARVYTYFYRFGKDLRDNELPDLLWVHAKKDDAGSGVPNTRQNSFFE